MLKSDIITLAHGGGGRASAELTREIFLPAFANKYLESLSDGALLPCASERIVFSTDSFVIDPLFFPGGNIGSLAIHGTVNDVAVCGATPKFLSAGFILEEGLKICDLKKIVASMASSAALCKVPVVTGDTKVVPRGSLDGVFINTSGIGFLPEGIEISSKRVRKGDKIILSGTIGDHGLAVLTRRKGIQFESQIVSDSQPLHELTQIMLREEKDIHMMRDPTRGGLAASLHEIAISARVRIMIEEEAIPVTEGVKSVCEILGLDPVHVANEGKLVAFVPPDSAGSILTAMKSHPAGREAAVIGSVTDQEEEGLVEMQTSFFSCRILEPIIGDQLPRIC